jgi:uncharacterized protein (DUF3820 family)
MYIEGIKNYKKFITTQIMSDSPSTYEQTLGPVAKVIDEDGKFLIGKHKGRDVDVVIKTDQPYIYWMSRQPWAAKDESLMKKICNVAEPGMAWGKHKGKSLSWILSNDESYIQWLKNSDYVKNNCPTLKAKLDKL